MVPDQRVEAVLAEAMDVTDELRTDGEISGAVEKHLSGGAEADVGIDDLLNCVVVESVQNPQIES